MKSLSLLTLLFCCHAVLFAQKGFLLGVRAIPMYTRIINTTDSDKPSSEYEEKASWGMAGGIAVGYNFHKNFGLMANVLYSSQGQNYTSKNALGQEINHTLRLRYLKIPLMFRATTNPDRKYMLVGELGPQLGILTSVEERDDDKTYKPEHPQGIYYTNVPDRYNTFNVQNWSVVGAAGLDIKLRFNLKMNAMLRVDYSFGDAEDKSQKYNVTEQGITREEKYYPSNRAATQNLTVGAMIGFTYIFIPKFHY